MKKYLYSYIPFLILLSLGIVFHDVPKIWMGLSFLISVSIALAHRRIGLYVTSMVAMFVIGSWLFQIQSHSFESRQLEVDKYNHQKQTVVGTIESFPVPSDHDFSYVLKTKSIGDAVESRNILIHSKNKISLDRGDRISQDTFLYIQKEPNNTQKIRHIDLYGIVKASDRVAILEKNHNVANRLRERIFASAKEYLSPKIYSYFRVMVFGDQALLGSDILIRLKETGLLHLFVISGTHITCILLLGFWICRLMVGWIPAFHRKKMTFIWIEVGSVLFVFLFLQLINPPISTFRAVGSMLLFVVLKVINRNQSALWNLGIVFFVILLLNPLFLLDVSTQLTFSSVFGILCANSLLQKLILSRWSEMAFWKESFLKILFTTLGACIFTSPILFIHFGSFYAQSFFYNLAIVPTLGELLSFVSVASVVWALIPVGWLQRLGFGCLEILFKAFEKMLFWKPEIKLYTVQNWLSTYSKTMLILAGFLSGSLAVLLFCRNRKQTLRY